MHAEYTEILKKQQIW